MNAAHQLDATFAALSDPTRRAIVERLTAGEATVLELAEPFRISLPAISRHLKVLEGAGLITRAKDAQWRPCRLRTEPLAEITRWADHTRHAWEQRFDRMAEYVREMQVAESAAPTTTKKKKQEKKNHGRTKR